MPVRIYLDQKDYSRIGKGISGNQKCAADAEVFKRLLKAVHNNQIRIYFSWCHIAEALRYDDEKVDLLEPYCEAIDKLTEGYCIRWPPDLETREIRRYLAQEYDVDGHSDTEPLGRYLHAFPKLDFTKIDFGKRVRDDLRKSTKKLPYPRNIQAQVTLANDSMLKKFIRNLPQQILDKINDSIPAIDFTRDEIADIVAGDISIREKATLNAFKAISSFRKLIQLSISFPDVKRIGRISDKSSDLIGNLIVSQRAFVGGENMDSESLYENLVKKFVAHHDNTITEFCRDNSIEPEEARNRLLASKFSGVPTIDSVLTFTIDYYKKHIATVERGRKPKQSDLMDLHHLRALPHVDIFLADAFFYEVTKKSSKRFGTTVVTSLPALIKALNDDHSICI